MKLAYATAFVIVGAMVLSPYVLLPEEISEYEGVVLYDIYSAKIKSMDPATCGDTSSSGIQGNIYEGLYTYHFLLRPVQVVPQLADGPATISDDGLTYTIALKPGVSYSRNPCFGFESDGRTPATRDVRAEDFVLAFKRIADAHLVSPLAYPLIAGRIEGLETYREQTKGYDKGDFSRYRELELPGVRAVDETTLEIRLRRAYPQLPYVLAMHLYAPIPHEVIEYHLSTKDDAGERVEIPLNLRDPEIREAPAVVGTGAYVLSEWERASKIVLKRNALFREQVYPSAEDLLAISNDPEQTRRQIEQLTAEGLLDDAGKRLPMIDVRDLTFVEESITAWMMFEHKRRDVAGIPRDIYEEVINPDKELMDEWRARGITLMKYTSPAVYWLAFNNEDKLLQNKALRQALCLCYDVERHIEVLFNGRGVRAVNTLPRSINGWAKAGPSPYARVDLPLARKKLALATEQLRQEGHLGPDEKITLTLDLGGTGEYHRRMGEFAQGQFRKIGVELEIVTNDWPTLQKKVHNKQTQIYAMGWHADYPDAENFLQLYYSPNIEKGTNNTNYSNAKFDRLFTKAGTLMDVAQRLPLYVDMVHILNEDCPVLLLSEPIAFVLYYDWVHNLYPHPIGYGYGKYTRIDVQRRLSQGGRR